MASSFLFCQWPNPWWSISVNVTKVKPLFQGRTQRQTGQECSAEECLCRDVVSRGGGGVHDQRRALAQASCWFKCMPPACSWGFGKKIRTVTAKLTSNTHHDTTQCDNNVPYVQTCRAFRWTSQNRTEQVRRVNAHAGKLQKKSPEEWTLSSNIIAWCAILLDWSCLGKKYIPDCTDFKFLQIYGDTRMCWEAVTTFIMGYYHANVCWFISSRHLAAAVLCMEH